MTGNNKIDKVKDAAASTIGVAAAAALLATEAVAVKEASMAGHKITDGQAVAIASGMAGNYCRYISWN